MNRVIVLALVTGCSLMGVKRPDDDAPARVEPECTTSAAWPVTDAVLGLATFTGFTVGALTAHQVTKEGALLLPIGIAFGASAAYGFMATADCRRAKADYRRTLATP